MVKVKKEKPVVEKKFYKIRDKNGLYSGGGMDPRFSKKGKVWDGIGQVHSHIAQLSSGHETYVQRASQRMIDEEWEVVEHIMVPTGYQENAFVYFSRNRYIEKIGKEHNRWLSEEIGKYFRNQRFHRYKFAVFIQQTTDENIKDYETTLSCDYRLEKNSLYGNKTNALFYFISERDFISLRLSFERTTVFKLHEEMINNKWDTLVA